MRILVTGSLGFIGQHLTQALLLQGHDVLGIDDKSGIFIAEPPHGSKFQQIDLRTAPVVDRILEQFKPEIVYHLAANAREGYSQFQPWEVTGRNIQAYMNVLVPAIKYGMKKMIMFSSMAVYGEQNPPFDEDMARSPVDVYGINKASMEEITEVLAGVHGFRYTIIRPHNVFGEGQSLKDKYRNVIGIFMNNIMRKEPLIIYGDGEQKRAFSYIFHSLPAFLKAMDEVADSQIINIGGIHECSINDVADIVCSIFKDYGEIDRRYVPARPLEVKLAWSTHQKSVDMLGYFEPDHIEEGIYRMANWARTVGPQDWIHEPAELEHESMPEHWKTEKRKVSEEEIAIRDFCWEI